MLIQVGSAETLLDDATRLGLEVVVGTSEDTLLFLSGLHAAITRYGLMSALFLDNCGGFISDEPEGEIEYWRIFAIVGEKIALDISYSCEVEDRDREERIIEGIVDSIQLVETGALPHVGSEGEEEA